LVLGAVSPRAAAGTGVWALLLLLALLPFAADIAERFRGDFRSSITFRAEYTLMALRVWDENPLLGIGFGASPKRISEIWWLAAQEARRVEQYSALGKARSAAVVHNVYLSAPSREAGIALGADPTRCLVVHPGIESGGIPPAAERSPFVLFAGRLDARKGYDHVVAAARALPHIRFRAVGWRPTWPRCAPPPRPVSASRTTAAEKPIGAPCPRRGSSSSPPRPRPSA
jgi:glycosyltransferase involved in cell wall biosynthesis